MLVAFNHPHEWKSCRWRKDQVVDLPPDLVMKLQDNNIVRLMNEIPPADLRRISNEQWRKFREACGVHPDPHVYYHSPRTFWCPRSGDRALARPAPLTNHMAASPKAHGIFPTGRHRNRPHRRHLRPQLAGENHENRGHFPARRLRQHHASEP